MGLKHRPTRMLTLRVTGVILMLVGLSTGKQTYISAVPEERDAKLTFTLYDRPVTWFSAYQTCALKQQRLLSGRNTKETDRTKVWEFGILDNMWHMLGRSMGHFWTGYIIPENTNYAVDANTCQQIVAPNLNKEDVSCVLMDFNVKDGETAPCTKSLPFICMSYSEGMTRIPHMASQSFSLSSGVSHTKAYYQTIEECMSVCLNSSTCFALDYHRDYLWCREYETSISLSIDYVVNTETDNIVHAYKGSHSLTLGGGGDVVLNPSMTFPCNITSPTSPPDMTTTTTKASTSTAITTPASALTTTTTPASTSTAITTPTSALTTTTTPASTSTAITTPTSALTTTTTPASTSTAITTPTSALTTTTTPASTSTTITTPASTSTTTTTPITVAAAKTYCPCQSLTDKMPAAAKKDFDAKKTKIKEEYKNDRKQKATYLRSMRSAIRAAAPAPSGGGPQCWSIC